MLLSNTQNMRDTKYVLSTALERTEEGALLQLTLNRCIGFVSCEGGRSKSGAGERRGHGGRRSGHGGVGSTALPAAHGFDQTMKEGSRLTSKQHWRIERAKASSDLVPAAEGGSGRRRSSRRWWQLPPGRHGRESYPL
jgi:hypothetical protein